MDSRRFDNAGYHFGLCAECAVKHVLIKAGVRNDEDVIWEHFPRLLKLATIAAQGRVGSTLLRILKPQLMQGWDVRMRYSKSGSINEDMAEKWRSQANEILGLLYG
jgi:hypothetical protein